MFLDDAQGAGGGDDAPPAAAGVLGHIPAVRLSQPRCLLIRIESADRLGRICEGRICTCHHRVGDHARHLFGPPGPPQFAAQGADQQIAETALRLRAAYVEPETGKLRRHLRGQLRAAPDQPHLRPVPVGHQQAPAPFQQLAQRRSQFPGRGDLVRGRRQALAAHQRVPADGHHRQLLSPRHAADCT